MTEKENFVICVEGKSPKYLSGFHTFKLSEDLSKANLLESYQCAEDYLGVPVLKNKGKIKKIRITYEIIE